MGRSGRTILIHSLGEGGHIGPTLKTAEKLRARGDRVIYMAELAAQGRIEKEGFDFIPFLPDVYMADATASPTLDWCLQYEKNMVEELESGRLEKQIASLELDLVMHDVTRSHTGWVARALGIPYLRVNTSFPNGFDPAVPPNWSNSLPGEMTFQEIYREWMVFDSLMFHKPRLHSDIPSPHKEYYERIERFGYEVSQLRLGTSMDLLDGEPELVTTSLALDYPSPNRPADWVYAGPCLRPDTSPDWNPPGRRAEAPLVLCAFGGQACSYPRLMNLVRCLMNVFEARPHLDIVLAGPAEMRDMLEIPENVHHVEWVPQRALLRQTDLFIMHGGQSSIKEALWEGVPLLVCPQAWDQRGNAGRVAYHGVGERVLEDEPSTEAVGIQIDALLDDPSYKSKAAALGDTLRAENDRDDDLRLIDAVMSGKMKPKSRQFYLDMEARIRKHFLG